MPKNNEKPVVTRNGVMTEQKQNSDDTSLFNQLIESQSASESVGDYYRLVVDPLDNAVRDGARVS